MHYLMVEPESVTVRHIKKRAILYEFTRDIICFQDDPSNLGSDGGAPERHCQDC
jgi:hypothetical protein